MKKPFTTANDPLRKVRAQREGLNINLEIAKRAFKSSGNKENGTFVTFWLRENGTLKM